MSIVISIVIRMIVIKLCEGCGFVVGMWMIFKGIRWVL